MCLRGVRLCASFPIDISCSCGPLCPECPLLSTIALPLLELFLLRQRSWSLVSGPLELKKGVMVESIHNESLFIATCNAVCCGRFATRECLNICVSSLMRHGLQIKCRMVYRFVTSTAPAPIWAVRAVSPCWAPRWRPAVAPIAARRVSRRPWRPVVGHDGTTRLRHRVEPNRLRDAMQ